MKYDLAARIALTNMIMTLFDHWKLSPDERAAILGLRSVRTLRRYQNGRAIANRQDLIKRVTHLLAIHKSLRILFPGDLGVAYSWVGLPNKDFQGKRPVEVMMNEELGGSRAVRQYLEFQMDR